MTKIFIIQAPAINVINLPSAMERKAKLLRTRLMLKFQVMRQHFLNGKLILRCLAKISTKYHQKLALSDQEIIFNEPLVNAEEMAGFPGILLMLV